jgi:hypothetical protein
MKQALIDIHYHLIEPAGKFVEVLLGVDGFQRDARPIDRG